MNNMQYIQNFFLPVLPSKLISDLWHLNDLQYKYIENMKLNMMNIKVMDFI